MRYLLLLITFLWLAMPSAHAQKEQGKGVISGTLIDSLTEKPVAFAAVSLIRMKDTTLAGGGISDEDGKFELDGLKPGRYQVKVDFMGYKPTRINNVKVKEPYWVVKLGVITMATDAKLIEGFEVVADRNFMESAIDRRVYNVDQIGTTKGASAEEVLQTIPSVEVDIDGNLSLRGNANVRVLIDGKPSGLTGVSTQAVLDQLPADAIERVEIITNPSAKYDPEGMAGIVNIILKKDRGDNFNGNIAVGVGSRGKHHTNAGFSLRKNKIAVSGSYNYRWSNRWRSGDTERINELEDSVSVLDQYSYSDGYRITHTARGGVDFYQSNKNTFSLSGRYSYRPRNSDDSISYRYLDPEGVLQSSANRWTDDQSTGEGYDFTARWRRDIGEQHNLVIDLAHSENSGTETEDSRQLDFDAQGEVSNSDPIQQITYSIDQGSFTTFQGDYTRKLWKKGKLEAGWRSTLQTIDNDFTSESWNAAWGGLLVDSLLENRFIFNQDVHAIYAIVGNQKGKLGYQLGLRAEQVYTTSEVRTTSEIFEHNYFSLYPSAHLSYEVKEGRELQASYSRRVNRPSTRSLNPFVDYSDPLNLRFGNPFLNPEYIDSYELTVVNTGKKMTLSGAVYYKFVHDVIRRVKTVDNEGVSTTTFRNLSSGIDYGLEFIASGKVAKVWSYNASANFFRSIINGGDGESDLSNDALGWSGKFTAIGRFKKGWEMQASGNYRSPRPIPQGTIRAITTFDVAFKKDLLKKKANLSLRISDILNTRNFRYTTEGDNFYQDSFRDRESRIAYLTFTWRFGTDGKKKRGRGDRGGSSGGFEDFDID